MEGFIFSTSLAKAVKPGKESKDIRWIDCLWEMIHEQGISTPGLKKLWKLIPCWEVAGCPAEIPEGYPARVDWSCPRTLHEVGDKVAERQAK